LRVAFVKHIAAPAANLQRATIVRVLDALTADGKAAMAARTAAYGRACYAWAIKRGSLTANPFEALPLASVEKRERVLSDAELRAVWRATGGAGAFNAIVRGLILTGQRRDEVAQMSWGEIAPDLGAWTISGSRAKNGVAHILPLSPQMRAHIEARAAVRDSNMSKATGAAGAFVFPGRDGPFNGFGKAKAALDETSNVRDWRLHDLRRTMATGLQRLGVRLEVTEAVLNHVSGSRTGIVGIYQRHDYAAEKRAAQDAWGAYVAAVVEERKADENVTPIRRMA
jgi:integrase